MIQKTLLALAVAGVMTSGSAFAQSSSFQSSQSSPNYLLTQTNSTGVTTGSFSALTGTNDYLFGIGTGTGVYDLSATAFFLSPSITDVKIDGNNFTQTVATSGLSIWNYSATNITAGQHTLSLTNSSSVVSSAVLQYTSVAPVPEPATITMMLAGLALVGGMQLRRKKKLELAG